MKRKQKIKIAVISIIALIVLFVLLHVARNFFAEDDISNVTYKIRQEKYENVIDVAGVVSAAQEQTLQALSDGTVVAVYVKQGDHVKKGDMIIQLDDTTQQYNLAKHDYEMETTRISGSKKELALMETERLSLVQKITERKVTATFDGIIAEIDVAVGDSLEAKDSVGTLVDVSYLLAEVEVAETDVAKLVKDQEVEFTFPAYSETVKGYVTGWPAIGEVTSRGATVVNAILRIDSPYPEEILPNFSFSGKIKISPDENFLIVEKYAIGRDGKNAYVVKKDSEEKIEVMVRPYDTDYVKIESGDVKAGDVLKAQTSAAKSGQQRGVKINKKNSKDSKNDMGGMGAGGPPPGGF
ncbi:HlyD family efflux transporter periplasmic adaptor subunit [Treponema sp.]|uniref:efflux RND transporter periplasmic adaptor subunit n=1 Tax=Treponema sp. TaxID=166 RepID=UPI0025DCBEAE|nr:HlyD family efflux transporter periplasmic adaptor subunit [Treponema sp.]MCR5218396.1 HlyD family efflux transporter periplasmic adaptor subunit [Treponema sp.]